MRCQGFTTVELATAIALLCVVVGVGVPSFTGLVRGIRIANTASALTTAVASARMEAIRRNSPVTVCPTWDGSRCARSVVWSRGWMVFVDTQRLGQPAEEAAIIRRFDAAPAGLALQSTPGRTYIRFQPSGWSAGTNTSIRLCDTDSGRLVGAMVVNNSGRSRVERPVDHLPCPYPL